MSSSVAGRQRSVRVPAAGDGAARVSTAACRMQVHIALVRAMRGVVMVPAAHATRDQVVAVEPMVMVAGRPRRRAHLRVCVDARTGHDEHEQRAGKQHSFHSLVPLAARSPIRRPRSTNDAYVALVLDQRVTRKVE